ncbi:MAG: hypothetical protein L0H93_17075 [Nocardioides sp.]|nr:hypothetical protein [Nocardioides sp.]
MADHTDTDQQEERPDQSRNSSNLAIQNTPNAEKFVLEADTMRRRQLRSALLHGTSRNWRETRRAWPGVVLGLIVVAVIIAGLAVVEAFQQTEQNQREEERKQGHQTGQVVNVPPITPSRATSGAP